MTFRFMGNLQKDGGSKDPPFLRKGDVWKSLQPDIKHTVRLFSPIAPKFSEGSEAAARGVGWGVGGQPSG